MLGWNQNFDFFFFPSPNPKKKKIIKTPPLIAPSPFSTSFQLLFPISTQGRFFSPTLFSSPPQPLPLTHPQLGRGDSPTAPPPCLPSLGWSSLSGRGGGLARPGGSGGVLPWTLCRGGSPRLSPHATQDEGPALPARAGAPPPSPGLTAPAPRPCLALRPPAGSPAPGCAEPPGG